MKINIQSLSFHASDKLIDYAEDKISKLSQYSDRIIGAQVTLRVDRSGTRDNKVCEVILEIPGKDLFAGRQCHSFEEAILRTSEALKQQLLRWKRKYHKASFNRNTMSTSRGLT